MLTAADERSLARSLHTDDQRVPGLADLVHAHLGQRRPFADVPRDHLPDPSVRVGTDKFILPATSVQMALRPTQESITTIQGTGEVLELRGRILPLHRLHRRFGIPSDAQNPWDGIVVIVEHSGKVSALLVDEMVSKQEVVIKNLGAFMQSLPGVAGGAILGDGNIALILDPGTLLQAA